MDLLIEKELLTHEIFGKDFSKLYFVTKFILLRLYAVL